MYYVTKNNELVIFDDDRNKLEKTREFMPQLKKQPTLETNIITADELRAHPSKVVVENGMLMLNPDYEQEEAEKEAERIGNLQCTKRVFVLMLEQLGLDYFEQIEPAIMANRQAKLEWELCVELQRKNPLIDQLASGFGITSKQLDDLFKFANGEITQEEFIGE